MLETLQKKKLKKKKNAKRKKQSKKLPLNLLLNTEPLW